MDSRGRRFLGRPKPASRPSSAGRRVTIAGTFTLGPDFVSDGTIVDQRAHLLQPVPEPLGPDLRQRGRDRRDRRSPTAGTRSRCRHRCARFCRRRGGVDQARAARPRGRFQNDVSPVGPIFLIGTLIGFAVGILICYQIMFTDLSDFLPQYATLKAIGYTNRFMVMVALQQALFYALLAFWPAWLAGIAIFAAVGEAALLPMRMTLGLTLAGLAADRRHVRDLGPDRGPARAPSRSGRGVLMLDRSATSAPPGRCARPEPLVRRGRVAQPGAVRQHPGGRGGTAGHHDRALGIGQNHPADADRRVALGDGRQRRAARLAAERAGRAGAHRGPAQHRLHLPAAQPVRFPDRLRECQDGAPARRSARARRCIAAASGCWSGSD